MGLVMEWTDGEGIERIGRRKEGGGRFIVVRGIGVYSFGGDVKQPGWRKVFISPLIVFLILHTLLSQRR